MNKLGKKSPSFKSGLINLGIPLVSVLLALLVGSILLLIMDVNPFEAYRYLIFGNFTNIYNVSEIFVKATPIILTGLAFTFAYRSGLFNIGADGQMFAGAIAAVYMGLKTGHLSPLISIPLCLIAAMIAGGIVGLIPGWLKGIYGTNEIITTIMLNYALQYLVSYVVDVPLREASGFYPQTDMIGENAFLPYLISNTRLHIGFLVALVLAFIVYLILWRTPFGFKLRATGFNSSCAEYSGISIKKGVIIAMVISGALAGVAGFTEINGIHHRLLDNFSSGVGYDGIAAALLGNTSAGGVVIASMLLGMLQTGASAMQRGVGIPANIVNIIQALIILFVLIGNKLKPKIMILLDSEEKEAE